MPQGKIEPASMHRVAEPGQTVVQDFVVAPDAVPNGTMAGSVVGGDSFIRFRNLVCFRKEFHPLSDEEIEQLPPALREKARKEGLDFVEYAEFGRVGSGEALDVQAGTLVKGEVEFIAPAMDPPDSANAVLVVEATGWEQPVRIPLLLVVGGLRVDLPTEPIQVHRGAVEQVAVHVTLPSGSPASDIKLEVVHPDVRALRIVSVPAGGLAATTLDLTVAADTPLGDLPIDLSISGFEPLRPTNRPLLLAVKPPAAMTRAMEQIQRKAAVLGEGPPGPRFPASDVQEVGDGGYVQHYSTGDVYWHPQTGAQWVYGAILAKYVTRGGPSGPLGFPVTDETATPDQLGRFNRFEKGSIYYSPQTGAHDIRGPVRDHWERLGSETSYLGYPTTDQTGEQLDFEHGTITFKDGKAPFDAADSREIKTGVIHVDDAAANGFAELLISSNGAFRFNGSMRSTGALSYDVAIVTTLTAGGQTLVFAEEGDVEGTFVLGGNRAHTWHHEGVDTRIKDNFDLWRTARAETTLTVDFGAGDLLAVVATIVGSIVVTRLIIVAGALAALFASKNVKGCGFVKQKRFDHHTGETTEEGMYMWVPIDETCPEN
ncbi:LGFP repeat-containing protein [Streptomyces sp. NPDC059071]|uniref:LGFP repeat-containing protein n=1 Tax=unclassified Streptomyces TaxID=2593676 RepID=UPI003628B576